MKWTADSDFENVQVFFLINEDVARIIVYL